MAQPATTSNYELSGRVKDGKQPLSFATVSLLREGQTQPVSTAKTDSAGLYLLRTALAGNYSIKISFAGFKPEVVKVVLSQQHQLMLPDISLHETNKQLNEVTVNGRKRLIEQQPDRTIVNTDALITNAGGTALDVLSQSPGVEVGENGQIRLKGKAGAVIFIDDKPTYVQGASLESYLRSIPSATIERIELMPNPPASFDAAGNAGVINIRTKKNNGKGFNATMNLAYIQGRYGRGNNNASFNYHGQHINVFGTFGYNRQNGFTDFSQYRRYFFDDGTTNSYLLAQNRIRKTGNAFTGNAGVDFYQSEKDTWGIVISGISRPNLETTANTSTLLNAAGATDSVVRFENHDQAGFKNLGISLNYRHEYDKTGKSLTAEMNYLVYQPGDQENIGSEERDAEGNLVAQEQSTLNVATTVRIYSARTDYTHTFSKGMKLTAGLKSSLTNIDNQAISNNITSGITVPDYGRADHFSYRENIGAAYINMNKEYKQLTVQAGLRFETTYTKGHQLASPVQPDSLTERNYRSAFPTVFLTYKLDTAAHNILKFNYGRRINRPLYESLNPNTLPVDKFTVYHGNPFLLPAYGDNFELSHTYDGRITTTLNYSRISNYNDETIQFINHIYYSTPGNIGTRTIKSISVDALVESVKWLSIHLYGQLSNAHYVSNFYTGRLNSSITTLSIDPMLQFSFGRSWKAQTDLFYITNESDAQFTLLARSRLNAGISKKLSDAVTLKFSMNDILYRSGPSGIINDLANAYASYRNKVDSRYGVLSLSWRLGTTFKNLRKYQRSHDDSEQERI